MIGGSGGVFPALVFFVYFAIVLVAVGMGFYLSYLAIRALRKYLRS